jgi:hypothetical protein
MRLLATWRDGVDRIEPKKRFMENEDAMFPEVLTRK